MQHLVVVAGHAIFQEGRWHGGFPGEEDVYAAHVDAGIRLCRQLPDSALAFSGGRTRPELAGVTNSEAEGMREYAHARGAEMPSVVLENFARDSFENLLFSLLACHARFGVWPRVVHAVTWTFKANRCCLIACGLRLGEGRFQFHGDGVPDNQLALERASQAAAEYEQHIVYGGAIADPLHRGPLFVEKRARRTPPSFADNAAYLDAVKAAYGHDPLLDAVERVQPGPAWRDLRWPW